MSPMRTKRREASVTNRAHRSQTFLDMGHYRNYNSDGFEGKISFWTEQLDLAQLGEGRYSLERAESSLKYFIARRDEVLLGANCTDES